MTAQWEAGRKAHSDFHAAQKDTWPIYTWQIMTSERSGSYMTASPGHHWSDFDAREAFLKIDAPDIAKNLTPYLASTTMMFWMRRSKRLMATRVLSCWISCGTAARRSSASCRSTARS